MSDEPLVDPPPDARLYGATRLPGLHDAGPSGRVRLDALARWVQDVAHADLVDAGVDRLAWWVVRRTRLQIHRFPRFGELATISTFCSGLGRLWAERRTTITTERGGRVEAVAIWVHLHPEKGTPLALHDEELAIYGASAAGRTVKARLRHPALPADAPTGSTWDFRVTELDIADHVNNAAYWTPVEEALVAEPEPTACDVEIEYVTPAQPGLHELRSAGHHRWLIAQDGTLRATYDLAVDDKS
jgi:acyl-ACP thioesterase